MNLPVLDRQGKPTGTEVSLDERVFGIEPNDHAMYLAVKVQRARMRQGTHASKNRSLVRGGGRKPWRQKGRGTARAGTMRSPLWRHGGTIFGPQPHPYVMSLPRKVNQLARRSALSCRAKEEAIRVIENVSFEAAKTRDLADLLSALDLKNEKVLVLTPDYQPKLVQSARNLKNCSIQVGIEASTLDLLNHRVLIIIQGALESISEVLGGQKHGTKKTSEAAAAN